MRSNGAFQRGWRRMDSGADGTRAEAEAQKAAPGQGRSGTIGRPFGLSVGDYAELLSCYPRRDCVRPPHNRPNPKPPPGLHHLLLGLSRVKSVEAWS